MFATVGDVSAQGVVGFRSGFTEGNGIPPRSRVDLDYGSSATNAAGTWGFTAGEVTAHVPMTRRFGMRLHFNSYTWVRTPQATVAGREDMGIGTALRVRDNVGWRPATALLTRVDMPSGSLPGQGNAWRPTVKAALAWQLPAGVSLASNLGLAVPGSQGARFTQAFGSLWFGRNVKGPVGSFAEVFAFDREARSGPATRHVRGGLTVLVTNSFHLDLNASTQFGTPAPRRSFGLGVKHRL
ncbi:hypothetical protein GEMMAAP_13790 [Gemmatimonas phototrophica]|uniref:Autotransporter domain-containing protein n=1 Tax=Gemmatimonas phototrophica TaxID=1379270 RepID=A0A143BM70_9BACT|nr:hypothetical protein GEMMAAP_13790 [Gemmatimonas phototrophica]